MGLKKILPVFLLALVLTPQAWAASQEDGTRSLYERLGGETIIRSVVDDFVARAGYDEKLNFTRAGTSRAWDATSESVYTLKRRLTEFIASATGGPQAYNGRDMKTVHAGMQITHEEFARLAGHLKASLDFFKVPEPEQKELLAIVAGTEPLIVEEPRRQGPRA